MSVLASFTHYYSFCFVFSFSLFFVFFRWDLLHWYYFLRSKDKEHEHVGNSALAGYLQHDGREWVSLWGERQPLTQQSLLCWGTNYRNFPFRPAFLSSSALNGPNYRVAFYLRNRQMLISIMIPANCVLIRCVGCEGREWVWERRVLNWCIERVLHVFNYSSSCRPGGNNFYTQSPLRIVPLKRRKREMASPSRRGWLLS